MMLLWFIIGTGVVTLSAVAVVVSLYLAITGWLDKWMSGEE